MILFRYLTRELLTSLLLITSILFFIFISNQFVLYLNQMAGGRFAVDILWQLIILKSPRFLTILLPFGLYLAILFTYGRLYADYEMITLHACGFGLGQLTWMTLPLVMSISLIVAFSNFWLVPELSSYSNRLLAQTGTAIELQVIKPGSFQQMDGGKRIIYVESISNDRKAVKNIFMAQVSKAQPPHTITPWTILTANSGYQMLNPKTKEIFFVAVNGKHYKGIPGEKKFYITEFANYFLRLDSHIGIINNPQDSLSSLALWQADTPNKPSFFSELHWRLSAPIATVLLALLAIPLSRVNPRQGKYLHLLPAITIAIFYLNLLLLGRNWIENAYISYRWGLWWIHGLLIIIIFFAWCYAIGFSRIKYQLNNWMKLRR